MHELRDHLRSTHEEFFWEGLSRRESSLSCCSALCHHRAEEFGSVGCPQRLVHDFSHEALVMLHEVDFTENLRSRGTR